MRSQPHAISDNVVNAVKAIVLLTALLCGKVNAVNNTPAVQRRIVLCLDGTWNNPYDEQERTDGMKVVKPSNPLKLCRAVLPKDHAGHDQITYYHVGVGSMSKYPGPANELLHLDDRFLGGVWGAGFEANVEEALHFVAVNYQPGDAVFVFGFSRGAATARGVTQFLDWNQGLPVKEDVYFLPRLFEGFVKAHGEPAAFVRVRDGINEDLQHDGRPALQPFHPVQVTYLGVWDTVVALGSRFAATGKTTADPGWTFYARESPAACVRHARQALAIDEQRYDFRPEVWTHAHDGQRMEQRWFAGVHSNVGGGYVHDGLANIAFKWMLDGATDEGLQIDEGFVKHYTPFVLDSLYDSSSLLYTIGDALRFRLGKGKRRLVDRPASANLTLDASVIKRLRAPADELRPPHSGDPIKAYRPKNVLLFLACQPNLEQYLASIGITDFAEKPLPDDVITTITQLRHVCTPAVGGRDEQRIKQIQKEKGR